QRFFAARTQTELYPLSHFGEYFLGQHLPGYLDPPRVSEKM
ncbi:hypothetical protein F442_22366, partial [Phytophthora nicotianae P10297]